MGTIVYGIQKHFRDINWGNVTPYIGTCFVIEAPLNGGEFRITQYHYNDFGRTCGDPHDLVTLRNNLSHIPRVNVNRISSFALAGYLNLISMRGQQSTNGIVFQKNNLLSLRTYRYA